MKKKIMMLALILLTILIFAGCADIKIDAEITPENLVTYSYIMNFTNLDSEDPNYEQLEIFLMDIQKYWEENGVDCETNITDTSVNLTGTMQKQCADREEAFNTLYEYMTNKISLFESVNLDYTGDFYSSSYTINAKVDLSGVLDEQIYRVHPKMVTDDVDEFMQNITCTAVFRLPYSEENSSEITLKETSTNISFESATDIYVTGSAENIENIKLEKQLKIKLIIQTILIVVAAVVFLAAMGMLIFMAVNRKKNRLKNAEPEVEKPIADKSKKTRKTSKTVNDAEQSTEIEPEGKNK